MKKITKLILLFTTTVCLYSCSVQQYAVNTPIKPFANGGRVFGEKTEGKEIKKSHDFFIIGINVKSADTQKLAEDIKATSYTIESKFNFLSWVVNYVTFGVVEYKVVKVIKR